MTDRLSRALKCFAPRCFFEAGARVANVNNVYRSVNQLKIKALSKRFSSQELHNLIDAVRPLLGPRPSQDHGEKKQQTRHRLALELLSGF